MSDYKPSRNSRCLCGSGKKFKRCCAQTYKADRPATAAFTAFNEERYEEALEICRAEITQYTIWHKNHTEPLLHKAGADEFAQKLLHIDIRALSELVGLLFHCYEATNRLHKFAATLERLKSNIADPRWEQKIVYYRALATLGRQWNEQAAREVLKQLEPIDDIADPEILQLYLDLNSYDLAFSKKQQIIERIISLAETPVDRLHYRSLKGVELFLIGDSEGSTSEVEQAIQEFRKERKDSLTTYERFRLGMSLDFLGSVKENPKLQEEARELYQAALLDEDLSRRGRADFHRCIAETWVHQEDWQKAKDCYLHSLNYEDTEVVRVLIAECFIGLDDISRALEYLNSVEFKSLDTAAKADYAFTYAIIALKERNIARASQASELLRNIELRAPYFRERRDSLLLALQSLESRKLTEKEVVEARRTFFDVMRLANRYFLLQPNVVGLGLDMNKIIEDWLDANKQRDNEART